MSHFTVLVLTDGTRSVESLLEPYNEDGTWFRKEKAAYRKEGKVIQRPASKWDWWAVGGRWTGLFSDYDPSADVKNWSVCDLCGGTGTRTDQSPEIKRAVKPGYYLVPFSEKRAKDLKGKKASFFDPKHPPSFMAMSRLTTKRPGWILEAAPGSNGKNITGSWQPYTKGCNGCQGSGASRNFINREVGDDVNTLLVRTILVKYADKEHTTHAVVTPDGKWHENGEMGWFGMMRGDRPMTPSRWEKEWIELLTKYKNCTATLIDAHV